MRETNLYEPVRKLLESRGYVVKGEIRDIDVFALKEDDTIGVELKQSISLKLVSQAVERQRPCDKVYLAVPDEAIRRHVKNNPFFHQLLKRLDLGLIAVEGDQAFVVLETDHFDNRNNRSAKKKKKKVLKEFRLRKTYKTRGGTNQKRMTHYREKVIAVALTLKARIEASPKQLKAISGIHDAGRILQKNYYGWFERVRRGLYRLSDKGKDEIEHYTETS